MRRIPATGRMRKDPEELLNGAEEGEFLLSELIKKGLPSFFRSYWSRN